MKQNKVQRSFSQFQVGSDYSCFSFSFSSFFVHKNQVLLWENNLAEKDLLKPVLVLCHCCKLNDKSAQQFHIISFKKWKNIPSFTSKLVCIYSNMEKNNQILANYSKPCFLLVSVQWSVIMLVLQMHISPFSQNICLQDINLVTFDFFLFKKTNSKGKILKCKKDL